MPADELKRSGAGSELLFEIGTEELPSWYVKEGSAALAALLSERLSAADVGATSVTSYGSPRRLSVVARGLPGASALRTEELRGPPAAVAFDDSGAPTRAALAFADKNGVGLDALERRETDKGSYLYATVQRGGVATTELLPALLAQLVKDLPAPRKMRWGSEPTPFVRPVAWLLALLNGDVIDFEVAGVRSGATTRGHRFLAPGELPVGSASEYLASLEEARVLADRQRRREATAHGVQGAAAAAGLSVYDDPALLDEVTDLVEWPFPILGAFEDAYLELPEEVLATVMIKHQRFFPTRDAAGALAARFVGVSNNQVADEGVVRNGYEQVLAGRLYDARFFWRSDLRKSLSQHAWGLSGIAFQKELGSMADKIERVGVAAETLLEALAVDDDQAEAARRALPIFRADLATDMVYEFPELEGVMARAYALAEGLPEAAADALLGGVQPKTHDDAVPATEAGAVLAVADRLDKLVGFFALGRRPTGSADPFGLRRDGLAVARVLGSRGWKLPLAEFVNAAVRPYESAAVEVGADVAAAVEEFVWDRVSVLLQERAAVPTVRAAVNGSRSVTGAARRVELLNTLLTSPEAGDLMALYKRAANLAAKADESAEVNVELFREPPEAPLHEALGTAREGVQELLAAAERQLPPWDLRHAPQAALSGVDGAIAKVVSLKAPLDDFLDNVLVMADDAQLRRNRLALLSEVVEVLRRLGELEELEGT
ncbi:MAG: glycine--tRNA ligase subunit beta [Trueperaceae bacterium]